MPPTQSETEPEAPAVGRTVLDARDVARALTRISHEILERNRGSRDLVLLGIPTRGVHLARRIAAKISEVEGVDVPVGSLDVTMYRDDLRMRPARALLRAASPKVVSRRDEQALRESPLLFDPLPGAGEARIGGDRGNLVGVVLVAALGPDRLARFERDVRDLAR